MFKHQRGSYASCFSKQARVTEYRPEYIWWTMLLLETSIVTEHIGEYNGVTWSSMTVTYKNKSFLFKITSSFTKVTWPVDLKFSFCLYVLIHYSKESFQWSLHSQVLLISQASQANDFTMKWGLQLLHKSVRKMFMNVYLLVKNYNGQTRVFTVWPIR